MMLCLQTTNSQQDLMGQNGTVVVFFRVVAPEHTFRAELGLLTLLCQVLSSLFRGLLQCYQGGEWQGGHPGSHMTGLKLQVCFLLAVGS
jgi:hypothetical protein